MDGVQVLQNAQVQLCTCLGREGGWGPGSGTCTQAVSGRSTSGEEEAAKLLPIFTFLWIHPLLRALYWLHLLMYNLFLERL